MAPQSTIKTHPVQRHRAGIVAQLLERVDHRRRIVDQRLPRDQAGEHDGDADVEQGADYQRSEDADRHIALRPMTLFRRSRDRIEADVSKER